MNTDILLQIIISSLTSSIIVYLFIKNVLFQDFNNLKISSKKEINSFYWDKMDALKNQYTSFISLIKDEKKGLENLRKILILEIDSSKSKIIAFSREADKIIEKVNPKEELENWNNQSKASINNLNEKLKTLNENLSKLKEEIYSSSKNFPKLKKEIQREEAKEMGDVTEEM